MRMRNAMSLAGGLALATVASAGIDLGTVFFTYDDPNGPPRELMYTAGNANQQGHISYFSATPFDLVVDASEPGWGVVTYAATISMDVTVGQATQMGNVFFAPVSGGFNVTVGGDTVLTGVLNNGAFLTFGTTGNLSANTATASVTMSVSGDLLAQFGGNQIQPDFNVSWSLSDYLPSSPSINQFGYLTSFMANTAFVGSANVVRVPTPGSAALLGIAGLISLPRRRS